MIYLDYNLLTRFFSPLPLLFRSMFCFFFFFYANCLFYGLLLHMWSILCSSSLHFSLIFFSFTFYILLILSYSFYILLPLPSIFSSLNQFFVLLLLFLFRSMVSYLFCKQFYVLLLSFYLVLEFSYFSSIQ